MDHHTQAMNKEGNVRLLKCTCSLVGNEVRRHLIFTVNTNPNPKLHLFLQPRHQDHLTEKPEEDLSSDEC